MVSTVLGKYEYNFPDSWTKQMTLKAQIQTAFYEILCKMFKNNFRSKGPYTAWLNSVEDHEIMFQSAAGENKS